MVKCISLLLIQNLFSFFWIFYKWMVAGVVYTSVIYSGNSFITFEITATVAEGLDQCFNYLTVGVWIPVKCHCWSRRDL
jgi:hypothetical protein